MFKYDTEFGPVPLCAVGVDLADLIASTMFAGVLRPEPLKALTAIIVFAASLM